ncbi:MAG: PH domain-containing protein [Candidatus Solibacter usitatus]|nr:PH domain-containing protein [Candidatus Solibacter usitatus]
MADVVLRPSLKFVKFGYLTILLIFGAAFWAHYAYLRDQPPWLPAVAALLLIWPLNRHARRQFIKVTIEGEKLRYETGWLSKSTRIIQLPKVQDVRVNQTVVQRMFGVGDVAIETAGEASRLTVPNLDQPQVVANQILDGFHKNNTDPSGHGSPGQ